jgi:hypothetical protein
MTGGDEVRGHRTAHVAQPQKSDLEGIRHAPPYAPT